MMNLPHIFPLGRTACNADLPLDARGLFSLTASRWFPDDDSEGINREHGEADLAEAVAAPATVSGLPSIPGCREAPCHCARPHGKADGRQTFASQETCHHRPSNQPGGDAREGTDMIDLHLSRKAFLRLDWALRR
jgi:hypothetical protein